MFKPKTYIEYCQAMQMQTIVEINSQAVIIKGIAIENGSGRGFNITIQPITTVNCIPYQIDEQKTTFVRTE